MNLLQIENKSAKVKLNDQVHKYSVDQIIEEIEKVYGMAAVENAYAFGEITACAENAVDTLEIEIHSPGGSVFEGYRIYNAMRELRERGVMVTAKINTLAASMGSVIAMAADKVTIASNGRMMIHDASGGVHGNADAMRKTADMLEEISDEIADVYAGKTGMDKDKIRKMMKSETWITAKKAVEMGFADEIFDTKTKVMSILDKFRPDAALVEKVTGLEASLADTENQVTEISAQLVEAQNDLATAITELSEAKNQISDCQNKITEITAERDAAASELTASKDEISTLQAAVKTAEESANAKALEIAAQAGLAPVNASTDEPIVNHLEIIKNLNPVEKTAYVKKHKKDIQLQLTK